MTDTSAEAVAKVLDGVTDKTVSAKKCGCGRPLCTDYRLEVGGKLDGYMPKRDAEFFAASLQLVPALSRDLEAMRARAEQAEAERDTAIARERAFRAVLEGAGYQKIDSITTPEYGKALGEMVAARTKEVIFNLTAALAREQALLEGNEINRRILEQHNSDHAAKVAALQARVAELEAERVEIGKASLAMVDELIAYLGQNARAHKDALAALKSANPMTNCAPKWCKQSPCFIAFGPKVIRCMG